MKQALILLFCIFSCATVTAQNAEDRSYPYAINNLWGLVDQDQNIVLQPSYQEISLPVRIKHDDEQLFVLPARKQQLWGLLEQSGKEIIPFDYDEVIPGWRNAKIVVVKKQQKYGLFDYTTGQLIGSDFYDQAPEFRGYKLPVAVIIKDGKYGAVNGQGNIIAKPTYKMIEILDAYSDFPDLRLTKEDGSQSYLDSWGDDKSAQEMQAVLEKMMWEDMIEESEVIDNNKPSYTTEQTIIKNKKSYLVKISYSPGYKKARQEKTDTLFNIESIQNLVLYTQWQTKLPKIAFAICSRNGKLGITNGDQQILTPFEYDRIEESKDQLTPTYLYKDDLRGVANTTGTLIADAIFTSIKKVKKTDLFFVEHPAGYKGYVSSAGTIYLPLKDQ